MSFGRLTGVAIALLALTIVPGLSQLQAQETAAARITNAEAKVAVDAAEAERIGLVNKVVPHDRLMAEAKVLAKRLANGPAMAIRGTKHAINKKVWNDLNLALDMGLALEERSSRHPDHHEAARSFVEKRPPEYKGAI